LATTGCGGLHFSFLDIRIVPLLEGPIALSRPANSDAPNIVAGKNLFEFLCLGSRCGYWLLEFVDDPMFDVNQSVSDILERDFKSWKHLDHAKRHAMHVQQMLDFLVARVGLAPWPDVNSRLDELHNCYFPLLEVSPSDI
jgi:hypothetical protein